MDDPASGARHQRERANRARREFDPDIGRIRDVRRHVEDVLTRWGTSARVVEDARLVAHELAANAVLHARSAFVLTIDPVERGVRVAIEDRDGRLDLRPVETPPDATMGRGLRIVADIAAAWGVEATPTGKRVWADVADVADDDAGE